MSSSFRVPAFIRPRHSFHKLRSFHLSPADTAAELQRATAQEQSLSPIPGPTTQPTIQPKPHKNRLGIVPRGGMIPLRGSTLVTLATIASLFFIMSISFAFIGEDMEEPYYKKMLDGIAIDSPGIVLMGESVDVDVDEPSLTIRWSILACGDDVILPGSAGSHGSALCGLPAKALYIYVDNDNEAAATYDPSEIPFNKLTGQRRSVQNLVQFDSDHVLDVHEARLYPFDTYFLTSTLRAESFNNETLPIRKLFTIDITSSFNIATSDMESFTTLANNTERISRDIDVSIRRPGEARAFALLLFALSWVLTHITIGHVILARRLTGIRTILKHLISAGAILVTIPQIRQSMPDAPGLDGVLIDSIGYFPQMVLTGTSVIILLLILVVRELDLIRENRGQDSISYPSPPRPRPPPSPTKQSSSTEIAQYDLHRLVKHLKGQYVFPPIQPSHQPRPSNPFSNSHRRCKTMSKIMEAGEANSHWSDEE